MKTIFKTQILKSNVEELFNLNNISKALFSDTYPTVTSKPFKGFRNFRLSNFQVDYSLNILARDVGVFEALSTIIVAEAASKDAMLDKLYKLPPWTVATLISDYRKYESKWITYISGNIYKFCKDNPESRYYWNIFKNVNVENVFTNNKLSVIQSFWVDTNATLFAQEEREFLIQLKESLLPWINPKLYSDIKDKEDNKRDNTEYEKQHSDMLVGKFDNEEDLDLIK